MAKAGERGARRPFPTSRNEIFLGLVQTAQQPYCSSFKSSLIVR